MDNNFGKYIKINVLDLVFPILNYSDKIFLSDLVIKTIKYIVVKYDLKDNSIIHQFKQNNNRDILAIVYILLPYIDDVEGKKKKRLSSLNELFVKKDNNGNFVYTNIQYDRCNIKEGQEILKQYNREFTEHNFKLLKRTIFLSANKGYVNWLNILPYTMDEIYKTNLYKNTLRLFNDEHYRDEKEDNINETLLFKLCDVDYEKCILPMDDIYNTILHDLFLSVKTIKWLIFETMMDDKPVPFVIILNSIINLDTILQEKKWNYLNDVDKQKFTNGWRILKNESKNDKNINFLFKNIYAFFQRNYKNVSKLVDNKLFIKNEDAQLNENIDDESSETIGGLDIDTLIKNFSKTPIEHIYGYFYDTIISFKKTWYFLNEKEYLTKNNRTTFKKINENHFIYEYDNNNKYNDLDDRYLNPILLTFYYMKLDTKLFITLKNIYNIAKSLTHTQINDEYIEISKYYASIETYKDVNTNKSINVLSKFNIKGKAEDLNIEKEIKDYDKIIIDRDIDQIVDKLYKRLNEKQHYEKNIEYWFNISNYLKNLYKDINPVLIKKINVWIFYVVKKKFLLDIIFEILVKKGVLSYFKPNKYTTDESLMPTTYSSKQKYLEKQKKYLFNKENCEKFNKAYYYFNNKPYSEINEDNEYFNKIIYEFNWMTTYAMDWISQINFFHRYIHNRVIFVTGSTGVGKSTEIPKLLLYALKAIDYKSDGKIVCTQPRVPPTEMVSSRVSDNIGFPITERSQVYNKDVQTDNFYIQYKHQKHKHINLGSDYNLKFVTDGTLLQELVNSPFCKKIKFDEKEQQVKYSDINLYDIIIVDEAHEHNPNMDIILSLAKHSVYYNNDIKLVIISATMDDDEPIYRRFYRCINDNRKIPLDLYIKDYKLDRINVDRRLHISPPGQLTRFKIDEIYESKLMENQKTWEWSFKRGIERVMEICKTTKDGDILFFVTGVADIIKAVKYINKETNIYKLYNVVCLPYYSELSSENKKLIEEIDKKKVKDNFTKHKETIENNKVIKNDVPKGTYTRAIIVSTNLAEASITINSLKYVVDTGYANDSKYIYNIRSTIMQKNEISESSRIQRKGRVGRVNDGVVYYTYEKNGRFKNKTKYKIADGDISDNLYDLLSKSIEDKSYFDKRYDINVYNNVKNKITKLDFSKIFNNILLKNNIDIIDDKNNIFIKNIGKIIEQYIYYSFENNVTKEIIYEYFGLKTHQNYELDNRPHDVKEYGYSKETLYDIDGTFYIIHPDKIKIDNKITGYVKEKSVSLKIKDFFRILENNFLLIKSFEKKNMLKINHKIINKSFYKTEYGYNFKLLKNSVNSSGNEIIPYIYGEKYNCREEVLNIICLLKACQNDISKLVLNKSIFKNLYSNKYGDYIVLLKIYKFIKIVLKETNIFSDIKIDVLKGEYERNSRLYNNYIKYDKKKVQSNIEIENYEKFKKLEYLNGVNEYEYYIKDNYKYLLEEIKSNSNKIKDYCLSISVNPDIIIRYLQEYIILKYSIFYNDFVKKNNIREDETVEQIDVEWFDENNFIYYKTDNICKNIILSFMHGYGENIGIYSGKNRYVNIIQKQILFNENMINPNNKYVMYNVPDNRNFEYNKTTNINVVNNIELEWLFSIKPYLYDKEKFERDNYTKSLYYIKNDKTDNTPNYDYYNLAYNGLKSFKNDFIKNKPIISKSLNLMAMNNKKNDKKITEYLKNFTKNI